MPRATVPSVLGRCTIVGMATDSLLPLREVTDRLRVVGQHYVGLRSIPIERIVGSVDRSVDFTRFFQLRQRELRQRVNELRRVFGDRPMPPISVYEASDLYFVSDGHHRVALARQDGGEFIDAEVTALELSHRLHAQVDLLELIHTEQHRQFNERSGLLDVPPEAHITFSRPVGYGQLLELLEAHAYKLTVARGSIASMAEATADWYETSWLPAMAAIQAAGVADRFSFKTDADRYLWVHEKLHELRTSDQSASWDDAATARAKEPVTRGHRDDTLRQRRTPLPPTRN